MKNRFFDLDELFAEVRQSRMYSQRFESILTFKLNNLRELCGRLPENGEAFFIETRKSFTAFTFIVYLIKHAGYVRHLYIATYSTNERIINALLRWKDKGLIGTIHLHVSETLKFRMPEIFQRLKQLGKGLVGLQSSHGMQTERGDLVCDHAVDPLIGKLLGMDQKRCVSHNRILQSVM